MQTRTYPVTGMTCEHCKAAVEEEVGAIAGVESVTADVAAGQVEVSGTVDEQLVRAAVEEAGYELG